MNQFGALRQENLRLQAKIDVLKVRLDLMDAFIARHDERIDELQLEKLARVELLALVRAIS